MRVVWLCAFPLSVLAGRESGATRGEHPGTWVTGLLKALVATGADPELHVITESRRVRRGFTAEWCGARIHVVRSGSCVPWTTRGWPRQLPWDALTRYALNSLRLGAVLRRVAPDLVHAHGTEEGYALAALRSGLPTLISVQGLMHLLAPHYPGNVSVAMRGRLERQVLAAGRHFVAKTAFARDVVAKFNPRARIYDIPNPVNPVFAECRAEPARGGGFFSWEACSRPRASRCCSQRSPGWRMPNSCSSDRARAGACGASAAGGAAPPGEPGGRARAASSGVGRRGNGPGFGSCAAVLHGDQPERRLGGDVRGSPGGGDAGGGIPDMVTHGETGWLVRPGDAAELAAGLDRVLADAEAARRMAARARAVALIRHDAGSVAGRTSEPMPRCCRATSPTDVLHEGGLSRALPGEPAEPGRRPGADP